MKKTVLIVCLLALLCLCACGGKETVPPPTPAPPPTPVPTAPPVELTAGSFPQDTRELTAVLEPGETEKLSGFSNLQSANFDGSLCLDEICAWAAEHPEVDVYYTVTLPDGQTADNRTTELDLSSLSGQELSDAAGSLAVLPLLERIGLGSEDRENAPVLSDVKKVLDAAPGAVCDYTVTRFGRSFSLADESLDMSHTIMDDGGAAAREILECMPRCTFADFDTCHLSNEEMAAIRDAFPAVKVVWRVWFGSNYTVRTDVERILASRPTQGGELTAYNTQALKYCTDVKYLDIGHNPSLESIDFVAYMPKLEVAVVALCHYVDATPLANCKNLEYLEMQTTWVEDLTPLAGLTNLRHLNIGWLFYCTDITPLYGLTGLERLWIGSQTPIPAEQVEEFRARVPDCEVNTTTSDPTEGGWRVTETVYHPDWDMYIPVYHPRYELLRQQFDYDHNMFSLPWNDPYYRP